MIEFSGRAVLLDIEGTTSSISFVVDVMFPFVRRELETYLAQHWHEPGLAAVCDTVARDAGQESFAAWLRSREVGVGDAAGGQRLIREEVARLMDGDVKATGLKQLQGMIWEAGFESGELRAHLYDDVCPAIESWRSAGLDVQIYSSGSVQAQKLFFGHTERGDLLPLLSGHYDTTVGSKKEAASYLKIAVQMRQQPIQVLFLSDIVAELDAAAEAGMRTGHVVRSGNSVDEAGTAHPRISTFAEIHIH